MIKFCIFDKSWLSIGYSKEEKTIEIVPFEFIAHAEQIFLIKSPVKIIIQKKITCNEAYHIRDISASLAATQTALVWFRSIKTPFESLKPSQISELQMKSIIRKNNLKVLPLLFNDKYKTLTKVCLEYISKES